MCLLRAARGQVRFVVALPRWVRRHPPGEEFGQVRRVRGRGSAPRSPRFTLPAGRVTAVPMDRRDSGGGGTPVVSGRPAVSDYRLSQPGLSAGFSHVVYTSSGERVASARGVQGAVPTQARESVLSPRGGTNAFNVFGGASAVASTSTTMPDVAAGKGDVGKHGRPSGPYQREER